MKLGCVEGHNFLMKREVLWFEIDCPHLCETDVKQDEYMISNVKQCEYMSSIIKPLGVALRSPIHWLTPCVVMDDWIQDLLTLHMMFSVIRYLMSL